MLNHCCGHLGNLGEQPLTLLLKQYRDLASQPGSLGVVSLGMGYIMSPASTASERVTLEPIISPEVQPLWLKWTLLSRSSSSSLCQVPTKRARSAASWTSRRRILTGLQGCMTLREVNAGRCRKIRGEGGISICHQLRLGQCI